MKLNPKPFCGEISMDNLKIKRAILWFIYKSSSRESTL